MQTFQRLVTQGLTLILPYEWLMLLPLLRVWFVLMDIKDTGAKGGGRGEEKRGGRREIQIPSALYFFLLPGAPEPTQTLCPTYEILSLPFQKISPQPSPHPIIPETWVHSESNQLALQDCLCSGHSHLSSPLISLPNCHSSVLLVS